MQNISEILNKSINYLKENNTNSAVLDSELLLCSIINKPREYLFLNLNKKINDISVKKYFSLVKRRKNSEPIAYILNKKDFWKSTFYVDQGVLIPRPDTEILIEEALSCMSKKKKFIYFRHWHGIRMYYIVYSSRSSKSKWYWYRHFKKCCKSC